MEKVASALSGLDRKKLELLATDLMSSLLVWQGQEMTEKSMMTLLESRVGKSSSEATDGFNNNRETTR